MKKTMILLALLTAGCVDNSTPTPTHTGSGSKEYNYVNNRFKAEGYSDKDSQKAADAVMKFHEAQKRRKN